MAAGDSGAVDISAIFSFSADDNVQTLDFEDYLSLEQQNLAAYDKTFGQAYKDIFDDSDGKSVSLLLSGEKCGVEVYYNADDGATPSVAPNAFVKKYDKAILLLYAPKNSPLCYNEDIRARQLQNENFCAIYPGLKDDPRVHLYNGGAKCVHRYQDMKMLVDKFIMDMAKPAKKMLVVFNGHGVKPVGSNPAKLSFLDKTTNCPLDKVITDVKATRSRVVASEGSDVVDGPGLEPLLGEIDLVFAQCYGHCFPGAPTPSTAGERVDMGDHLTVIPLSQASVHQGRTRFIPYRLKLTKEIRKCIHEQLRAYAQAEANAAQCKGNK